MGFQHLNSRYRWRKSIAEEMIEVISDMKVNVGKEGDLMDVYGEGGGPIIYGLGGPQPWDPISYRSIQPLTSVQEYPIGTI
jgi:hypothetical protein